MDFLKKLFGGGNGGQRQPVDKTGIYLYVRSTKKPDAVSKLRIDKNHDLNSAPSGYVWHKTIVDPKYFTRVEAVVYFDHNYRLSNADLSDGEIITEEEFEAVMTARKEEAAARKAAAEAEKEQENIKQDEL